METRLRSIEELPATYRAFVHEVVRANLDLARNGVAQLRHRPPQMLVLHVIRLANVKTKVYLTTSHQDVFFLFIRGPVTEDVMLQLDIEFSVKAAPGRLDSDTNEPVRLKARVPPLFAAGVDEREVALLSAELNHEERKNIVFLKAGRSILGAIHPENLPAARVARLDPGTTKARVVFQRVASPDSKARYQYEPVTFLEMLDEIAAWARAGRAAGGLMTVPLPDLTAPLPAQKIVAAAVAGWMESRKACARPDRIQTAWLAVPPFEIGGYRGEVVLRLKSDGSLAEKLKDDIFRLRLSINTVDEGAAPWVEISFDPPDFLVSGRLYERLSETIRHPAVVRILVNSSEIAKPHRETLARWVGEASRSCFVFRAKKDGDVDTDVFVLRSLWDGVSRVAIAVVDVKVSMSPPDDYTVRFVDAPGSIEITYTDIPGAVDRRSARVPEYVLMLVHQLRNWVRALRP